MDISDTKFFDIDESFVIQSSIFDNQSKSMVIEKRDVTNGKGKSRTEIDFSQMTPSKICSFHQVTGDVLRDSIGGMKMDYANLKHRLNEFE